MSPSSVAGWREHQGTDERISGGRAVFLPQLGSTVGSAIRESSLAIDLVMLAAEAILDD